MDKLNEVGTPVLVVLMVLGFIWFWPVGLALLCYLLWSGQLRGKRSMIAPWLHSLRGSGNKAFDDHRAEVVSKLEQEQEAFGEFLDNLRNAKDKAEFDQFMASRK